MWGVVCAWYCHAVPHTVSSCLGCLQSQGHIWRHLLVCFVGCLTSQLQASVSQGQICWGNFTCCHTEIEVAEPTFYLTQSQYTRHRAYQSQRWPYNVSRPGRVATGVQVFKSLVWLDPEKSRRKWDSNPGSSAYETDALTTRPSRWSHMTGRPTCHYSRAMRHGF